MAFEKLTEIKPPENLSTDKVPDFKEPAADKVPDFSKSEVSEKDKSSDNVPDFSDPKDIDDIDKSIAPTQENRSDLPELNNETRERLEANNWPSDVLDNIGSEAEVKIYEDANLEPAQVHGKEALIRTDIDYNQKDIYGRTNLERMEQGLAPLDATGKPIELHHIGQKQDSPLAELTFGEHRGKGNDNVLHDKRKESEIDRESFNNERQEHWKARAEQIKSQQQ